MNFSPPPQSIPTSLKAHDRMRTHDYAPETYCEAENEGYVENEFISCYLSFISIIIIYYQFWLFLVPS